MGYAIIIKNDRNPTGKVTWVQPTGDRPQVANPSEETVIMISDSYARQLIDGATKQNVGDDENPVFINEYAVAADALFDFEISPDINLDRFLAQFEGSPIDEKLSQTRDSASLSRLSSAFMGAMQNMDFGQTIKYFNKIIDGLPQSLKNSDRQSLSAMFKDCAMPLGFNNNGRIEFTGAAQSGRSQ